MTTLAPARADDRPSVSVAKALGSSTRAGIYEYLGELDAPATVRDVAATFDVHPNVARTHLDTLVDAGLVEAGRRKNPAGGRPANVYRVRRSTGVPATRASGVLAAGDILVRLLGSLLDHAGQQALPLRAEEVALREGRRLSADLPRADGLAASVETTVEILRSYAPGARVVNATDSWVDIAGVAGVFRGANGVRGEVADGLARGLVAGVLDGLGTPVSVADAGALPDGEPVWRLRPTEPSGPAAGGDVARTVDTRRLHREAGVVEAMRAVTALRRGEILEVLTQGPGSPAAFARWADRAGHQLLGVERAVDAAGKPAIRLLIRKGR